MGNNLARLRKKIDNFDRKIIRLFEKRFKVCKQVGIEKEAHEMNLHDPHREKEVINNRRELARIHKIDEKFVEEVFDLIMKESKRLQNRK